LKHNTLDLRNLIIKEQEKVESIENNPHITNSDNGREGKDRRTYSFDSIKHTSAEHSDFDYVICGFD
jgi:hypothetical protein